MHTNLKIGIGSASGVLIGGLGGYLVSRKLHKKAADVIADDIMEEVVPAMFQTVTMIFTGMKDMTSMDNVAEMNEEEIMKAYEKLISDGFEFFNLTMKDKYGVAMNLEIHREASEED